MTDKTKKILIALLLLAIAFLGYTSYINNKEFAKKELAFNTEKDLLLADFNKLKVNYEDAISKNTFLSEELTRQKNRIEDFELIIKKMKRDDSKLIRFYKKKIEDLTITSKKMIKINDSLSQRNTMLNVENQDLYNQKEVLAQEKDALKVTLNDQTTFNDTLVKQNLNLAQKVAIGETIKASDYFVTTYKDRRNDKYKESDRASRVDMFKVGMLINENQLAPKKDIKLNIVITNPDGSNFIEKGLFTTSDGKTLKYAQENVIPYNKKEELALFIIKRNASKKLKKGTYITDFYMNGKNIKRIETFLK